MHVSLAATIAIAQVKNLLLLSVVAEKNVLAVLLVSAHLLATVSMHKINVTFVAWQI